MSEETVAVLDKEAALDRMGGDEEIYEAVLEVFLEDVPKQLATIRYLESGGEEGAKFDREEIRRTAHSLKSAAANIGGDAMSHTAAEFEKVAEEADAEELLRWYRNLSAEFEKLKQTVSS